MKKLFCDLLGHSLKKPNNKGKCKCSMCGVEFIYCQELDHYFTEKELYTENEEDLHLWKSVDLKESESK